MNTDERNNINLLYCGNDRAFDGILVSLLSIVNYTKAPVNVFVITMDLSDIDDRFKPFNEQQRKYIENVIRETNPDSKISVFDISDEFRKSMLDSKNLKSQYTPYAMIRLYADIIPEIPDEPVLYLDTDTVAAKDISPIFNIDISEYEFGGVLDCMGRFFIRRDYMNSGVLYLNMKKIRETGLFKKSRELCRDKKMCFPDQSALNNLSKNRLFLDRKFNEQNKLKDDTVIQHFSKKVMVFPFPHPVNVKPWQVEDVRKRYKIHYYDSILDEYLERKATFEDEVV